MRYDRVLVTGGAGFIGSHTVDALLREGASVWVIDDLSTGFLRNLRKWKRHPNFRFRSGNTLQGKVVDALMGKVNGVIHLAAIVSPFYSVKRPQLVNAVNVTGTMNVLNAALRRKIKRLVFASSSSVYGEQTHLPIQEDSPLHPITPYGASKLAGEKYCEAYHRTYGLNTISLRYFNVYGPRQSANPYSGVIAIFSNRLRAGLKPTIFGDGKQTRDFIHVSDAVRANLQALNTNSGAGEAFNVGRGRAISLNELAALLARLANKPDFAPTHGPERAGDIRDSYADITHTKEVLGFESNLDMEEGLLSLLNPVSTRKGPSPSIPLRKKLGDGNSFGRNEDN